ncbi:MAG TPA: GAF domain-containing protein [Thermoanaerobaculia bacterium]|jgi:putative methionine-R-sulfoxide reductase with GAF domain|nr:GAF domain-containing protein [Thermoanaerobaculia bacterium]
MYLTGATAAGVFLIEFGVADAKLEQAVGGGNREHLARHRHFVETTEKALRLEPENSRATVWCDPKSVIVREEMRYRYVAYLVFDQIPEEAPTAGVRLIETFARMSESLIRDIEKAEFQLDQQRLLGRRTILAQLRPNDLLYHLLRKVNKFVPWQRSATVLAPVEEGIAGRRRGAQWYVAAERLEGVKEVSRRVGKQFEAGASIRRKIPKSVIVKDVKTFRPRTRWEEMLQTFVTSRDGLPMDLAVARSALIVRIDRPSTADEELAQNPSLLPLLLVLTDPTEERFSESDATTATDFAFHAGALLGRSSAFSRQLVQLWTRPDGSQRVGDKSPTEEVSSDADPYDIDALPADVLGETAPILLALDSVQVVQFTRGEISRRDTHALRPLVVRSVVTTSGQRADVELRQGFNPSMSITPEATLLWSVLESGKPSFIKSPNGIAPKMVAMLFDTVGSAATYRSAYVFPIRAEDEVAGLLIAYRVNASELIEVDKMLLESLAARLGERIELRQQVGDRTRLLSCISAIALADNEEAARDALVAGARALLNADHSFLMELDRNPAAEAATLAAVAQTWPQGTMVVPRLRIHGGIEGITGRVFTDAKPVVASDVRKNRDYRPMLDDRGGEVVISSELAVPIIAPRSSGNREIFGVLDAFWYRPHKIALRELRALETLGQQAGAVLRVGRSLRDAEQRSEKLQQLIDDANELEEMTLESQILNWLSDRLPGLIDLDLGIVWRHKSSSSHLDVIATLGRRSALMPHNRLPFDSWIGARITEFRDGGVRTALDLYDDPSPESVKVPGTDDTEQAMAAFLLRPFERLETAQGDDVVWAIVIYRFRPFNFDPRELLLLLTAGGHCESALNRIGMAATEQRTFELATASEKVIVDLLVEGRENPAKVIETVITTLRARLDAHSVSVLLYSDPKDVPQIYAQPSDVGTHMPPTRTTGLSEYVRSHGKTVIIDIKAPILELAEIVRTSAFYNRFADILFTVAVPMFYTEESVTMFYGVLYINFAHHFQESPVEKRFIETMTRVIIECGQLAPALARMREETFRRLQAVKNPTEIFRNVLDVALESISALVPARLKGSGFRLCGNISMIGGNIQPRLRLRANVGVISDNFPAVQDAGEGIVGTVAVTGHAQIVDDTSKSPSYMPYLRGMRSELAVPIIVQGEHREGFAQDVVGVLNIECSEAKVFTERHSQLAASFMQIPIASIVHVAERHNQLLVQERRELDDMFVDSSKFLLHDFTRPVRLMESRARRIREALPHECLQKIENELQELERESRHAQSLGRTGLLYLTSEVLDARAPLDVVEYLTVWAAKQTPPLEVRWSKKVVKDVFIDRGHPLLITSILDNLYQNSRSKVKIREGKIWLECKLVGHGVSGGYFDVYFHDNGCGITLPVEEWPKLFRMFARPRELGAGGWGMGLPLARLMMQVMGGDLDLAASKPFVDTAFRLRFTSQPRLGR